MADKSYKQRLIDAAMAIQKAVDPTQWHKTWGWVSEHTPVDKLKMDDNVERVREAVDEKASKVEHPVVGELLHSPVMEPARSAQKWFNEKSAAAREPVFTHDDEIDGGEL